mmetsp:Transcript_3757/g.14249  ORF Transcript_3757/g.14249 Transcript_3757/m.14249 type:complete len:236 (+) Transcript_3757:2304-3011(+)
MIQQYCYMVHDDTLEMQGTERHDDGSTRSAIDGGCGESHLKFQEDQNGLEEVDMAHSQCREVETRCSVLRREEKTSCVWRDCTAYHSKGMWAWWEDMQMVQSGWSLEVSMASCDTSKAHICHAHHSMCWSVDYVSSPWCLEHGVDVNPNKEISTEAEESDDSDGDDACEEVSCTSKNVIRRHVRWKFETSSSTLEMMNCASESLSTSFCDAEIGATTLMQSSHPPKYVNSPLSTD